MKGYARVSCWQMPREVAQRSPEPSAAMEPTGFGYCPCGVPRARSGTFGAIPAMVAPICGYQQLTQAEPNEKCG